MKNILIIQGHPETESFGMALAAAYAEGARAAGHEVRELRLRKMDFDPMLRDRRARAEEAPADVRKAREDLLWAQHVVVQYPTWWASTPALLKGFVDQVFVPGFAYRYHEKGAGWDRLLAGRTGRLLVTMDAPKVFDSLYYFASSRRAMSKGVFAFCGIRPTGVTTFASVRNAAESKRMKWLDRARALGAAGK